MFPVNSWLPSPGAALSADGTAEFTLLPGQKPASSLQNLTYRVTVATSDIRGAGTDSFVYVTIYGDKGDSGERSLESASNDFERGNTDTYVVDSVDLGEIHTVKVGWVWVVGAVAPLAEREACCWWCWFSRIAFLWCRSMSASFVERAGALRVAAAAGCSGLHFRF